MFLDVVQSLRKYYENELKQLEQTKPELFTQVDFCDFAFTRLKNNSNYPTLPDSILEKLSTLVSRDEWIVNYEIAKNELGIATRVLPQINKFFNAEFVDIFRIIEVVPYHSWEGELFSNEDALLIFNVMNQSKAIIDGVEFSTLPLVASGGKGKSIFYPYVNKKDFPVSYFCDEELVYKHEMGKSIFLDASLSILFEYKGKPSFIASFNFDNDKNLYFMQVQGLRKGRGHYKLGQNWRSKVIKYIKSQFDFSPSCMIASPSLIKNDLIKSYGDNYVPEIHCELFNCVEKSYQDVIADLGCKKKKDEFYLI